MKTARAVLWSFARSESGQDLVEYALVLALICLGAVAGLHSLANALASVPNALMQKFYTAYSS